MVFLCALIKFIKVKIGGKQRMKKRTKESILIGMIIFAITILATTVKAESTNTFKASVTANKRDTYQIENTYL